MRLLSITHYALLLGANRSLLHLLKGLKERHGVQLLVLCPAEGPFTAALKAAGIDYVVKPYANWGYSLLSARLWLFPWVWWKSQRTVWPEVLALAQKFNPDVVHSNSTLLATGWQLAEALGKPHIWHIREFGWKDYNIVFPLGLKQLREKLRRANQVIAISKAIGDAFGAYLQRSPKVIFNGIGTKAVIERAFENGQQKPDDGLFRFLIIGLLHPAKGQLDAVKAFRRVWQKHAHARLVIAGNGRKLYEWRLRWQAWKDGTSKAIQFCGFVSNPAPVYAQSDVVLMCSRHEAMGRVTAEAMSYGKPVIGFKGGATPEIIQPGMQGEWYESVAELSDKMIQMIAYQGELKSMGNNAFERALQLFADEAYVDRFYDALKVNQ
jgi:glycosyltransferase involved in cell wall biosynthesis